MTITSYRLKVLAKIESLSVETGVTSPMEIAKAIETEPKRIRVILTKLKKLGWVENPYPSSWRLTQEGWEVLKRVRTRGTEEAT